MGCCESIEVGGKRCHRKPFGCRESDKARQDYPRKAKRVKRIFQAEGTACDGKEF